MKKVEVLNFQIYQEKFSNRKIIIFNKFSKINFLVQPKI